MKKDGCKNTRSDLNTIDEKPIDELKTSAIDGKEKGKLSVDIPSVDEQSMLKGPRVKKEVPLSKTEAQPRCSLDSSYWQRKKLHKLSAQELKEKGMVWLPKGSIQTQNKDDVHTKRCNTIEGEKKVQATIFKYVVCTESSKLLVVTLSICHTNAMYAYVLKFTL